MRAAKRSAWDNGAWRPDARASFGLAAVAACLMMAGFTALFSAVAPLKLSPPAPSVRETLVLPELTPPRRRPALRVPVPHPVTPVQLPELQRMPPPLPGPMWAPDSFSVQDYLDERSRDTAAALKDRVTGSELKRDLAKQTEKPAISDNQSYRTIDGQRVERGGGGCSESQTQQGSSSPTNHFDVARPISCPGSKPDASQQMGKALDEWADKHRAPPPPP